MIIICSNCNYKINLSSDQLCKVEGVIARMPEGKTLKFKCPACKNPLNLNPKILFQEISKSVHQAKSNDTSKMIVESKGDCRAKDERDIPVYEFKKIYIPVDSVHEGEKLVESFDISTLQNLGKSSWDIAAVVPRTISQKLFNERETTVSNNLAYTAACGGNIMGVHIILRRCIV